MLHAFDPRFERPVSGPVERPNYGGSPEHTAEAPKPLTGTASWTLKTATDWILGIKPDFHGLRIDPCIPKNWDKFSVIRHFRNAIYDIQVQNPEHLSKGIKEVKVDNIKQENNLLPVFKDGKKHDVKVLMG